MTDDPNMSIGDNIGPTELSVGVEARKLIQIYERQLNRHAKVTGEIHETILQFGRCLREGKAMYPSTQEFGLWVERRGLNSGRLAKSQQERTACMEIARLHDEGAEIDADDDSVVPVKLTFTGCTYTTPTNIMRWARKAHRHLFPKLKPREEKPKEKNVNEEVRKLRADLAARDERITELEAAPTSLQECVIAAIDRCAEADDLDDEEKADLLGYIEHLAQWAREHLTPAASQLALEWYRDGAGLLAKVTEEYFYRAKPVRGGKKYNATVHYRDIRNVNGQKLGGPYTSIEKAVAACEADYAENGDDDAGRNPVEG